MFDDIYWCDFYLSKHLIMVDLHFLVYSVSQNVYSQANMSVQNFNIFSAIYSFSRIINDLISSFFKFSSMDILFLWKKERKFCFSRFSSLYNTLPPSLFLCAVHFWVLFPFSSLLLCIVNCFSLSLLPLSFLFFLQCVEPLPSGRKNFLQKSASPIQLYAFLYIKKTL